LFAKCQTPKLEDCPLSVVCDCLFNIFVATFHIGGLYSILNLKTRLAVVTGIYRKGDGGDLIDLAQDMDRWRALVNVVMHLRFP
jgi:hypothetical protein